MKIPKLIRTDGMFKTDENGRRIPFKNLDDKRETIYEMKKNKDIKTYNLW